MTRSTAGPVSGPLSPVVRGGHSSLAFLRIWSATCRPREGISRARWYYLIFALCVTAGTLPRVILANEPWGVRALGVGGLIWLVAHRLAQYRRGTLGNPCWDGAEVAVLLLAAVLAGFAPVLPVFFFGSWFRATLGTGRRVAAGTALYLVALVAAGLVEGWSAREIGLTAFALGCATLLTYTMARALLISLQRLTEQNDRASRIIETATDAFIETDADGHILDWNAQATAIFGWSREDVMSRSLAEVLVPAAVRPAHHALLEHVLASGASRSPRTRVEVQVNHRYGSALTAEVSVWMVGEDDDRRVNILLHNVTDRRRAAADLAEAQARFHQAFRNAPIGMVLADPSGGLLDVNRVFCQMLGRNEEELLACGLEAVTHPADLAGTRETMSVLASGAADSLRWEKRYLRADGGFVLADVSVSLTRDNDGAPRYFVAQAQDITERRATEQALAHQRAFIEAVLEDVDAGVVACDADGVLTVFNRATRQMHGLPAEPLPAEAWAQHYDLYGADGVTPLATEEVPLVRALQGELVRDAEIVIAPHGAPPRSLVVNGRPLVDGNGAALGAVVAMTDVTERRKAEAALSWQALHDPLTGRANRLLLRDRLGHALRRGWREHDPLVLMILDLDGFKAVNDSLGNEAGDQVLVTVANRMRKSLRPEDTLARIDGDEFAVILENTSAMDGVQVAKDLLSAIRAPITTGSRELRMEASVGLTVGDFACDAEEAVRNASLAMYAAKSMGKGRVQLYDPSMHEEVLQQLTMQSELHKAMVADEFTVHYQPVLSLRTGQVRGFEALVRWDHPAHGLLPPTRFIALAEATGLIVPLGSWILNQACGQLRKWQVGHPELGEPTMAVNLSVRQLQDPNVVESVSAALTAAGLPARQLVLEITESGVMQRGPATAALDRLHELGVRLAIDDFGTGYSSLSRLHDLPVDQVKIDKSFIDQLSSGQPSPVVAATIAIARSLGLETVAEGVESADQLPFLRAHDCDQVQGYLFGPPADVAAIDEMLYAQGLGEPREGKAQSPTRGPGLGLAIDGAAGGAVRAASS